MVSVVFRFVLHELSSHFVLHARLSSFRLERPLPSCRIPPWDLSLVLSFLRGPLFEPLSSCSLSLRDLPWWVLFLLSLLITRRVGDLQALSSPVSSSSDALFLSFLPDSGRRLSLQFVLSLALFWCSCFGFLWALYRMSSSCVLFGLFGFTSLVQLLFLPVLVLSVSPRSPSRSLSQVALSFCFRAVIADVYSSAGRSLPSAPSSSAYSVSSYSSSSSHSSLHANGVCGVPASDLFSAMLLWLHP